MADPRSYNLIKPDMRKQLEEYVENGTEPCHFLRLVISNNLVDATNQADGDNRQALAAYACYLYNEMPSPCWGSTRAYFLWMAWKKNMRENVLSTEAILDSYQKCIEEKLSVDRFRAYKTTEFPITTIAEEKLVEELRDLRSEVKNKRSDALAEKAAHRKTLKLLHEIQGQLGLQKKHCADKHDCCFKAS